MSKNNMTLEAMEMDELLDLKDQVDGRIESLARREMDALQQKMARLQPLVGGSGSGRGGKTGPAPAKFRDPRSGKTWSGRGRTPIWLREYEEQGRKRDEFAL